MNALWTQIKTSLESKYSQNKLLQVWFAPLELLSIESNENGDKFCLGVPSKLHKNWISQHMLEPIRSEIAHIHKNPFDVEIQIVKKESPPNQQEFFSPENTSQNFPIRQPFIQMLNTKIDNLNKDQTFETFVPGPNSKMAHGACSRIAQDPGKPEYNPLFIFGPTGLGKSHLLNAVGNTIKISQPELTIRYLSAEKYLNEFTTSLRRAKARNFREKYRNNCDVLLIDDIPFLGRGETTQEEFCNTLNYLREHNKQVVVTSDKMPKDIPKLEERIKTRLNWGINADISMPSLETRVAILKDKAARKNIRIPQDVIHYIARISKKSIRELEGNLNKVKMFSELQGLNINLELTKKVLINHEDATSGISIEEIQRLTADHYGVRIIDLKSKSRTKPLVTARQASMYLIKKYMHNKSLVEIGRAFGGKDHTTVINSLKRIEIFLKTDSDFKRSMEELDMHIQNITGL